MRVFIHYTVTLVLLSIYGLQVCPFISTLQAEEWVLTVAVALLLTLGVRPQLQHACLASCPLNRQPLRQFLLDIGLLTVMGIGIGLFNMLVFEFPLASALLVVTGTVILGLFAASDLALAHQYRTFLALKESGSHLSLQTHTLSLPKRFAFAASALSVVVAVVFTLVFIRDLDWIIDQAHSGSQSTMIVRPVVIEVIFIVSAVLAEILNIIYSYARNLSFLLTNQNTALQEVAEGNLTTSVLVGSNDEFGVMAHYTNTMIDSLRERTKEVHQTQDATIIALASLAETRDNETGQHILRTQRYVRTLAEHLAQTDKFRDALPPETIDLLFKSAPLHDVGKVGVPDAILLKPGKLNEEEWTIMRSHTVMGYETLTNAALPLKESSFLNLAAEIAISHHERWDGTGYPKQLKGEAIPLSGRLMALADVYDALISRRIYKPPFTHEKARTIILEGSGTHFDPHIVDAFIALEEQFVQIAKEYQDTVPATA